MTSSAAEETVLLDLNTLTWMYRTVITTPKDFDPATERAALLSLAKLTDPVVSFRYPEKLILDLEGHVREHYRDVLPQLVNDFPNLKLSTWIEVGTFVTEQAWFEDTLKNTGEQQDDVQLLSIAAFFEQRTIKRIATLDIHFINRLPSIHNRITRIKDLNDWVNKHRSDFFSIEAKLPSDLLAEYQERAQTQGMPVTGQTLT